jgi:tripartite-type tricarboxylate transporter receptor subunit TctC
MLRRFVLVALGATAVSIIAPTGAPGQGDNFPNNTVKIVVPTAPGGPLDVLGRLMTQRLATSGASR